MLNGSEIQSFEDYRKNSTRDLGKKWTRFEEMEIREGRINPCLWVERLLQQNESY
jgi:hypothetical protein